MNVFAKFDEILSMIFQDINERKRNGNTDSRKDNVKTVYLPTNIVCRVVCGSIIKLGYNILHESYEIDKLLSLVPLNQVCFFSYI